MQVFISYSKEDIKKAHYLKDIIENAGIKVYIDEDKIKPGNSTNKEIIKAIKSSDCFLLLMSRNSLSSDYVKWEIGIADGSNVKKIPIALEKVEFPNFLQPDILKVKLYEDKNKELEKLINFLTNQKKKEKISIIVIIALILLLIKFGE